MEREPEQKHGGKRGANAMPGDIDQPRVEGEQDCRRSRLASRIPLVRAFAQTDKFFEREEMSPTITKNDRDANQARSKARANRSLGESRAGRCGKLRGK